MAELNDPKKLFRAEALGQVQRQNDGHVILVRPLSFALLTAGVCAVLAAVVVFLLLGGYTRGELAKGILVPAGQYAKVYTFKPGVIREVKVQDGELVAAGDPLFVMEASLYDGSGENATEVMKQELAYVITLHRDSIRRERQSSAMELTHLRQTRDFKARAVEQLQKLKANQAAKVQALERERQGLKKLLARGLVSTADFNNKNAQYLDSLIELERMRGQGDNLAQEIQDLDYQILRLPHQLDDRLGALELDISTAQQRLSELSATGSFTVNAPIGGRVTSILGKVGGHVDQELPLLTILPQDYNLKAELYIPSRIISFVNEGQPVRLRYDAFPYQKFGYYQGRVESIDAALLRPSELNTNVGLSEPAYRITVNLDQQAINGQGKRLSLQPGMMLEAYLEGERRSLLEWIFEPLFGVGNRYLQ